MPGLPGTCRACCYGASGWIQSMRGSISAARFRGILLAGRRVSLGSLSRMASAIQIDSRTSSPLIVVGTISRGTIADLGRSGLRYRDPRLSEYE